MKMTFCTDLCTNVRLLMADPFILTWNVATLVTLLMPLMSFTISRLTNEEYWGQQGQGGNDQNNYQNPYENPENYDEYGNYVGPTHWWQFWKSNNRGNDGGGEDGNNGEFLTPWWCKYARCGLCGIIFWVVR
jgi:hypothetical protein